MSTPSMPPGAPAPSPTTMLSQLLRGSLVTQLIYVAATLGIADLLKTEARSSTDLATLVGADPQALYRVLRALASLGIFAETEPGWFTLTPLAVPLQSDVPGSLRGSAMVYGDRWFWQPCGELLHSVRTGQSAFDYVHNQPLFAYLDQADDAAASFNTHQTNMTRLDVTAILTAYDFAGFTTVVDVGGGHGALVAAIARTCPRTTVILFDQPAVVAGARTRLQTEGIEERCSFVAGDFFGSVPEGGDAYVLKDIIHDWDESRALAILRNCHQAMTHHVGRPARLLLVEKVIPPGNAPFTGKLTDITMLLITGGRERTAAEYQALLEQAGFTLTNIGHLRDYCEWQTEQRQAEFELSDDDIFLRTYLMQLRVQGADHRLLRDKTAVLKQFYAWAQAEGLISSSPFDQYNFDRPFLSRDQIRRRKSVLHADPQKRELLHLHALNRLAEQLNRSVDVQTALDTTLTTLVEVMNLHTAWAYVTTESGLLRLGGAAQLPHDFALVAACGVPPGLERDNRHYLRCAPDCHCQGFLRSGHLVRAVNVVECSRLWDSAQADGDNQGLLFHASAPILVQDRVLGIINVATEEWQFLTATDLQFLTAVGAQVAVALERAQLYDQLNTQHIRLERDLFPLNKREKVKSGLEANPATSERSTLSFTPISILHYNMLSWIRRLPDNSKSRFSSTFLKLGAL